MSLIYNKTEWKDDKSTPINAHNLNNIEDGIEYIYHKWDRIIEDATTGDHAAELIDARDGLNDTEQHPTLGHRLNHMDNKFKEIKIMPKNILIMWIIFRITCNINSFNNSEIKIIIFCNAF